MKIELDKCDKCGSEFLVDKNAQFNNLSSVSFCGIKGKRVYFELCKDCKIQFNEMTKEFMGKDYE